MRVRSVLAAALIVFVTALVMLGAWSAWWLHELGGASRRIIADNYDSVVAAQRMKESLERQDSAALFLLLTQGARARAQLAIHRLRFDQSFSRAAANITEPGEAALVGRIRGLRDDYYREFDAQTSSDQPFTSPVYFVRLEPRFDALRTELDRLLALNQEAMRRKSRVAEASAQAYATRVFVLAILLIGGSTFLAGRMSRRLVEPLTALTRVTDRMSTGDLDASATVVESPREVRDLALSFNRMQERLRELRQSDLGRLRAAQQLSDAAIDSLYDPVIVTDVAARITRANRAAADAFGPEATSLGRPVADLGAGSEIGAAVHQAIASGRPAADEGLAGVRRLTTTSGDREYRLRTTPLRSEDGAVHGSVTLLEDVTHLREIDRVKSDFIAVASHELRTPLTSMAMALPLLLEPAAGPLTDRQRRLVDVCRQNAERLTRLMQQLLDVGRLEAGRDAPVMREVAVADTVHAIASSLSAAAGRHGVRLHAVVPASLPPMLADRDQIERVLTNLVDNAIRASAPGGTVTIAARADHHEIVLSVADTGRGIRPEYLPRLFEKFSRAPDAPGAGAGLGLFIARHIVESHGGHIWARSEPGHGAVFSLSLPATTAGARIQPA